ncbi:MAG: Gfo/Idh/MocA family oxidoreductase [Candidatus Odinarchaeia archaeon]
MRVLDFGVIGVGNMGTNHLRVYSELRWVNRLYVYDVNLKHALEIQKKYDGVEVCSSLDEINRKVDAVSVCVPTKDHLSVISKCLDAGVNILVEKPVVLNSAEGELLEKKLKQADIIFGVGHIERFNPIISEINKLVKSPKYIEIKRHNPTSLRVKDSSVLEDLMIHDIDLIWNNFFFKQRENLIYAAGNDNFCKVIVDFNGPIVSLSASRVSSRKIRTIYVEDEDFSIEGNFMDQEVLVYRKPTIYVSENYRYTQENVIEKVLINKVEPLKRELMEFINCIRFNKIFPVTFEQAILNLQIVEVIKNKL